MEHERPFQIGKFFNPLHESQYLNWYRNLLPVKQGLISQNPDDPEHFYDYRQAFLSGAAPSFDGHLPSQFKKIGHPRSFLGTLNTTTMENPLSNLLPNFHLKRKSLSSMDFSDLEAKPKKKLDFSDLAKPKTKSARISDILQTPDLSIIGNKLGGKKTESSVNSLK